MRTWSFAVNADTGQVLITYHEQHIHICVDMEPADFAHFAGAVNGALGDSKMAAS